MHRLCCDPSPSADGNLKNAYQSTIDLVFMVGADLQYYVVCRRCSGGAKKLLSFMEVDGIVRCMSTVPAFGDGFHKAMRDADNEVLQGEAPCDFPKKSVTSTRSEYSEIYRLVSLLNITEWTKIMRGAPTAKQTRSLPLMTLTNGPDGNEQVYLFRYDQRFAHLRTLKFATKVEIGSNELMLSASDHVFEAQSDAALDHGSNELRTNWQIDRIQHKLKSVPYFMMQHFGKILTEDCEDMNEPVSSTLESVSPCPSPT